MAQLKLLRSCWASQLTYPHCSVLSAYRYFTTALPESAVGKEWLENYFMTKSLPRAQRIASLVLK